MVLAGVYNDNVRCRATLDPPKVGPAQRLCADYGSGMEEARRCPSVPGAGRLLRGEAAGAKLREHVHALRVGANAQPDAVPRETGGPPRLSPAPEYPRAVGDRPAPGAYPR